MRRFTITIGVAAALMGSAAGTSSAADGTWDRAWGSGVVCTTAASCLAGVPGGPGGRMAGPTGVATDAAGNVYVADRQQHRIQKFDSSGNFLLAWGKNVNGGGVFGVCNVAASCQAGTTGGLGGEMNQPQFVATDAAGNVYVSDSGNFRIQKFSSSGVWERAWGTNVSGGSQMLEVCTMAASCQMGTSQGLGGFLNPGGIATDADGAVYSGNGEAVVKFTPSGGFVLTWGRGVSGGSAFAICTTSPTACFTGTEGTEGGMFDTPQDVATDATGVYVADFGSNRIQKFDFSGNFISTWGRNVNGGGVFEVCTSRADCLAGTSGGAGGQMFAPYGVHADAEGYVYVSEQGNHRIQKFSAAGVWDRAWGRNVNGGGAFGICTTAGSCLAGTTGSAGGQMNSPAGLATDTAGNVFVVDGGNNRIQKFGSAVVIPPPPPPPTGGGGGGTTAGPGPSTTPGPTGKRAAALKKCRKAKGKARANCKRKANKLPV